MTLGQISEAEPPVVTRVVFSEADLRAPRLRQRPLRERGLDVHEDAIGNTFARWQGSEPALAPIGTGSHIDAIPNAGSMTDASACSAASKPFASCSNLDSSRAAPSNW